MNWVNLEVVAAVAADEAGADMLAVGVGLTRE